MYTATVLNTVKEALRDSKELAHYVTRESIVLNDSSESAPPTIGQRFCIVHGVDRFNPNTKADSYSDRMNFGITVGQRFREVPMDRVGDYLYGKPITDSVELLRDIIILYIYNNIYTINNQIVTNWNDRVDKLPANVKSLFSTINFVDRFKYLFSDIVPIERFPEYFSSNEPPAMHTNPRPAAITLTITFQAPYIVRPNTCS